MNNKVLEEIFARLDYLEKHVGWLEKKVQLTAITKAEGGQEPLFKAGKNGEWIFVGRKGR